MSGERIGAFLLLSTFAMPTGTAGQPAPRKSVRLTVCQILVIDGDRDGNLRRIAALARKHGLMIAIGIDEKDGDRLYDSAVLVDKTGKFLWKHRKINVLPELMTPPYSEGRPEDIGVVDTEFGRIAVLICADTFTDAFLDRLKSFKPDLALVPYGWAAPNDQWPQHSKVLEELVKKRAAELKCPMAGVDLVGEMTHGPWAGQTYGGSSFVADANGNILLSARDRDTDLRVIDLEIGSRAR